MSEWGWRNHSSANFYLAPTRAWELLLGCLAALLISLRRLKTNILLSNIGLVLILSSIVFFNEKTPFPSAFTLIPVTGTVLILLFIEKESLLMNFSQQNYVGIGLISYSSYSGINHYLHLPKLALTHLCAGRYVL